MFVGFEQVIPVFAPVAYLSTFEKVLVAWMERSRKFRASGSNTFNSFLAAAKRTVG